MNADLFNQYSLEEKISYVEQAISKMNFPDFVSKPFIFEAFNVLEEINGQLGKLGDIRNSEPQDERGLLTADERADVLNAVNDTLEKFGLEVCGYEDDGTFFNIQTWRR
jgi:hypothetical protein